MYKKILISFFLLISACTQEPAKYVDRSDEFYGYEKYVDQFIRLAQKPHEIIVKDGETLSEIASLYDVSPKYLITINDLKSPIIRPGQKLRLMRIKMHKVSQGENLSFIAASYGSTPESIIVANNLNDHGIIHPGEFLTVPLEPGRSYVESVKLKDYAENSKQKSASDQKIVITENQQKNEPEKAKKKALKIIKLNKPENRQQIFSKKSALAVSQVKFGWPVKGKIISKFGPKNKGYRNDGINIAAKEGTFVTSSNKGVVVYAGNDLKSYGNLVIIKHDNSWLTAYGHMKKLLVKKGQKVAIGQQIGKVGKMGDVDSPQLHFAMRYLKKPVDPMKYLP